MSTRDFPESDLTAVVYDQLPEGIRKKLAVSVKSDAYRLQATARFKDDRGREYECQLERAQAGGRTIACKIPEVFVTHLCAVV